MGLNRAMEMKMELILGNAQQREPAKICLEFRHSS